MSQRCQDAQVNLGFVNPPWYKDLPQPESKPALGKKTAYAAEIAKESSNRKWLIVGVMVTICVFFILVVHFAHKRSVHEESLTRLTPDEVIHRCGMALREKIVDIDPNYTESPGYRYMFYRGARNSMYAVRFDRFETNGPWKFGAVQEATATFFTNKSAALGSDELIRIELPCLSHD